MLRTLYIENIAVIEKTSIDFENGLNVLTGETGAGKSTLLNKIDKKLTSIEWNASAADKNGFDDYMLKEIFEQRDYTLISTEYVNNHTPIEYICNKHSQYGIQKITWMHLRNGEGCYYCGKESCKEKR